MAWILFPFYFLQSTSDVGGKDFERDGQIGQLQSTSHEKYSLIESCIELLFVHVLLTSRAIAEKLGADGV